MQLSQKTEYAVHSLLYLTYKKQVTLVDEIAQHLKASQSYLAKVMQRLSKAGLVKSYVGAGGGYILAKQPEEITFADVARIFEEETQVLDCLAEARDCDARPDCKILHVFNDAYQKMMEELEMTTIADLETDEAKIDYEEFSD
jgi:Rrf2 family protein